MKIFLGKIVEVNIDRPLGSLHPKYKNIYPINYGFIKGVKSSDGEDLDAYVIGVFKPLKKFKGRCIAIIHRYDDNEDKLVVAQKNTNYTASQIRALTEFQEKYFKIKIIK